MLVVSDYLLLPLEQYGCGTWLLVREDTKWRHENRRVESFTVKIFMI